MPGWKIVKINRFDPGIVNEILAWCADSLDDDWKKVGWSTGCSSTVGVAFENVIDAIHFKLRWA